MATKNIAITEKAYTRLTSLKKRNESFSEVINRITEKRKLSDFIGILSDKSADELEKNVKKFRSAYDKEFRRRIRNVGRQLA